MTQARTSELLLLQEWSKLLTYSDALSHSGPSGVFTLFPDPGSRAIDDDDFPFERLSDVAELESWRKEINRPLSHIHKWWAQRLGSIFRAIILGTIAPKGSDIIGLFYGKSRVSNAVIFDPFMGSGTTVIEAIKLGARAIGSDINAVAYFLVCNALRYHDRTKIIEEFRAIERDVALSIRTYYECHLPDGKTVPVLYYFWVKTVPCPSCKGTVDLFPSYVFARHAYPKRYPEAQAVCPSCGEINHVRFDAKSVICTACYHSFDPSIGPAKGSKAVCPSCTTSFSIAQAIRRGASPPTHQLYAKLVLMPNGEKKYLAITQDDLELYVKAHTELGERQNPYPVILIEPGYNTNQILAYNYRYWHECFNVRQLLCLSLLAERIGQITETSIRDLFICLFSGVLEFNNMFASYKGEGTGAVRHMFSHHILKPERTPLEANLWGTPKSSGSFLLMFRTRILRALEYAAHPFEIRPVMTNGRKASEKVFGLSDPIGFEYTSSFDAFSKGKSAYISCRDSSRTDLPDASIDAVVTDPPFFDNVHYSQLADFFYVWQRHIIGPSGVWGSHTTRSNDEVQDEDPDIFTERLTAVWLECRRVLKDDGLLVFTYHHSRHEGWRSVLLAIMKAGFRVTAVHPVKAELSVATPKQQAREPIDLDVIIVCRKAEALPDRQIHHNLLGTVRAAATVQVLRLRNTGRVLSWNDIRVIIMSQLLKCLSIMDSASEALTMLETFTSQVEGIINELYLGKGSSV